MSGERTVGEPTSGEPMSGGTPADGWVWPSGLPGPDAFQTGTAGGTNIRYPKSDHHLAHTVMSCLAESRERLAAMCANDLVNVLGAAGERLAQRLDDRTVAEVAGNAGLTPAMARVVVHGMADSWTTEALDRLLRSEFTDPAVLDGFVADAGREIRAAAPGVTVHVGAGSVPGVTVTSIIRALLVKSPVLAKPGAGDIALTTLFARELGRADDRLRGALAVQYWPGGDPDWEAWEREVLTRAGQVVVYGGDDAIESIRARTPAATRVIEHPHRLGVAIVDPGAAPDADGQAAQAVALFDQKGCVSTHLILVLGSHGDARDWSARFAARLQALASTLPPAAAAAGDWSARHQLRGRLALQRAASDDVRLWTGDAGAWTVALAPPELFEPVGGRTAWVVPVPDLAGCVEVLTPLARVLQTVGLAGMGSRRHEFGEALAAIGATRIVPLDQVPFPDPDWLHDGSRPLLELVRWAELR